MTQSDNKERAMRVIISGGGTGGHIFPALSIANELKRRDPRTAILFVGAENRMEMERVPGAGYDIVGLPVMGLDRKKLWRNVKVLAKLYASMRKAAKIINDFKPDIAVGVGGYASGPTLKRAQKKGVPTLLQEQNSYAGVTNKMLAQKADAICVAYNGMERFFPTDKIVLTGNPVRADLLENNMTRAEAKTALDFDPARPLILIVGGSLGSKTINEAVSAALPAFADAGVQLLWQTGRIYEKEYAEKSRGQDDVKASAFINDMAVAYRAADIVVSRAGASTISELQLLGKAAVLVPSPNVAEDHQTKNARALVERGAAVLVPDADAVALLPGTVVNLLTNPEEIKRIEKNVKEMALENAVGKIVDRIEHIVSQKSK